MKKSGFIFLFFLLIGITACKNDVKQTEGTEITTTAKNRGWTAEMNLNNGAAWEANKETTEGILLMEARIERDNSKSIEDYHALAADLDDLKNYIVKKCTMQGESHENLHVYLVPLMKMIGKLKNAKTVEEASQLKLDVSKHLQEYSRFFK